MSAPPTVVHRPGGGFPPLRPYLAEAWDRRALAWHLARSRAVAEHMSSALGQAWTILNPLLLAGVYLLLITVLTGRGGVDRLLLVLLGVFWFNGIRHAAVLGSRAVTDQAGLVLNATFPRILLVVASTLVALRAATPSLAVYAAFHLLAGRPAHVTWLLVVPLWGLTALLSAGVGAVLAAGAVRFRDLHSALPYLLRLLLYVTPVLYRVEEIPAGLAGILRANPLAPLFAALHAAVLDGRADWAAIGWATAIALAALLVGTAVFLRAERTFGTRL